MKKEKIKISFLGFNYEAENLTEKGLLVFIIAVVFMSLWIWLGVK
jgi:hypothetical protein